MELLKQIAMNRQAQAEPVAAVEKKTKGRGIAPALPMPAENVPGTKGFRRMIIEEKPSKKVLKEHFEGLIAFECESSDED